jgi:hypothetical protein
MGSSQRRRKKESGIGKEGSHFVQGKNDWRAGWNVSVWGFENNALGMQYTSYMVSN